MADFTLENAQEEGPQSLFDGLVGTSPPGGGRPAGMPPRGETAEMLGRDGDWPEIPAPIMAGLAPQAPYPEHCFPPDLEDVLQATRRLAQCPAAMTGAALLGALTLLVQDDYRAETLAPHPSPPSLYLVALAESGSHKTTTFKLVGAGHAKADARLEARWSAAKEQMEDDEAALRPLRLSTPTALLQDFTTDGLLQQLQRGRPSMAMWTAEAGMQVNYAFNGSQAPRTVSYLNAGWDSGPLSKIRVHHGSQIHIPGDTYSMSIVWAGQPDILSPVLFGPLALNGLLARCLISRDDDCPDLGVPLASDWELIQTFTDVVLRVRGRQDLGMEYAPRADERPRQRLLIALSPAAHKLLQTFYRRQRAMAAHMRENGQRHECSFAERAPEQAARVAALFTGWETYQTGGSECDESRYTDEGNLDRAISLVEWYQGEVSRLVAASGATDKAQYARQLASVIAQVVADPGSREGRYPLLNNQGLLVNSVANARGHPVVRGNTDIRRAVIAILEENGYIRPSKVRGRYRVHPRISEVA